MKSQPLQWTRGPYGRERHQQNHTQTECVHRRGRRLRRAGAATVGFAPGAQRCAPARIQAIPQPAAAQARETAQPADCRPAQRGWGRTLRPLVVGVGAAAVLAVALLAISPSFRAAAAQAVGEIRQLLGGGIATGPEGISTFRPAPPFNVKQPDYLPEGFKLVAQRYNPGAPDAQTGQGGVGVTVKEIRPQPASPAAQEAIEGGAG